MHVLYLAAAYVALCHYVIIPDSDTETQKLDLSHSAKRELWCNTDSIKREFNNLISISMKRLGGKEDLADFVIMQICLLDNECPKHHQDELEKCSSCSSMKVFKVLLANHYIRFWSFTLLENIVREYLPQDDVCVNVLPTYKENLVKHLSRRIFEHDKFNDQYLEISPTSINKDGEFVICVDFLWDKTLTVEEMYTLQKLVEDELKCGRFELEQIRTGSLVFCYKTLSSESVNLEFKDEVLQKMLHAGVENLVKGGREYAHKDMKTSCKFYLQTSTQMLNNNVIIYAFSLH